MPTQQYYAFYFVHILSRIFAELPNYYVKASPPFFKHLKTLISNLLTHLDIFAEGAKGEASVSTAYQLRKISARVIEKNSGKMKAGAIRILSESLGDLKMLQN